MGYTLIELLVVISIFSILTGIILFNQTKLNSTILVTNLAYDVALTVRQAQAYGISVSNANPGAGGQFSAAYGLHFDMASTTKIVLFSDTNNDGARDTGDVDISTYNIQNQRGNQIATICVNNVDANGNLLRCYPSMNYNKASIVDIVFKRPNPEPSLNYYVTQGYFKGQGIVQIVLNTPAGDDCRSVDIYPTGAVSVDNTQTLCR